MMQGITAETKIRERLDASGKRRFLFTVKYGKLVQVNILLLSNLLRATSRKVMFISIDRPHKYIELLLTKKKVPLENVVFVDMLGVGGFFWLKLMANTFDNVYLAKSVKCESIDFEDFDYIVIDNIAVLPVYNSEAAIMEFFKEFDDILRSHPRLRSALVTPREMHAKMFHLVSTFSEDILDIREEWLT
jgi:hypothetical protein